MVVACAYRCGAIDTTWMVLPASTGDKRGHKPLV